MRQALVTRLTRLEEKFTSRLIKPWLVLVDPNAVPPAGWESQYGGLARIKIVDGRQPYPIYDGERLSPTAWPNHLLVPMDGPRPEGEPIPFCLEPIPQF